MDTNNNLQDIPLTCWVCIFKEHKPEKYNVVYSVNMDLTLRKMASELPLLYMRSFACVQEAIGHKLFLEALTNESIERMILSMNPHAKDLRPLADCLI